MNDNDRDHETYKDSLAESHFWIRIGFDICENEILEFLNTKYTKLAKTYEKEISNGENNKETNAKIFQLKDITEGIMEVIAKIRSQPIEEVLANDE